MSCPQHFARTEVVPIGKGQSREQILPIREACKEVVF